MPNVIRSLEIPDSVYNAYSTQANRAKYPKEYFLLVEGEIRKFPYRAPDSGAIHCGLVKAAISRAGQYNYPEVQKKAASVYENSCKMKEKEFSYEIVEKDVQGGEVLGIVASPNEEPDASGHVFTKEAIRDMINQFNTGSHQIRYRHKGMLINSEAELVESYAAPCELTFMGKVIKEGAWLQRWLIKDRTLKEQVKEGFLKGFSLSGWILDADPL